MGWSQIDRVHKTNFRLPRIAPAVTVLRRVRGTPRYFTPCLYPKCRGVVFLSPVRRDTIWLMRSFVAVYGGSLGVHFAAWFFFIVLLAGGMSAHANVANTDPSCETLAKVLCPKGLNSQKYTKYPECNPKASPGKPLVTPGLIGAPCKEDDKTKWKVSGRCISPTKCLCEGKCLADGDKDGKPGEKGDEKGKEMMPMMMGMIPMLPMIPMGMPKMDMPMMPMQMSPTSPNPDGTGCNRTFSWLLGSEGCNPNPGGTGSTTASTTDDTEDGLSGIATKARRILNIVINRGARTEDTENESKGASFTPRYTVVSVTPKDVAVSMPADVKKQLPYRTDSDTKGYGSFSGASDDLSGGLFSWAQNAGTAAGDALENMRQLLLRMLQSLTF